MASQSAGIGSALPDQLGNSGFVLTTDGATASWENVVTAALPPQTGNSGKFLTTDGSSASWGTVSATISVGTFGSTPDAKAASFSAGVLTMQPADATHPGAVTAAAQTIGGAKTIRGDFSAANALDIQDSTDPFDPTPLVSLSTRTTGSLVGGKITLGYNTQGTAVEGHGGNITVLVHSGDGIFQVYDGSVLLLKLDLAAKLVDFTGLGVSAGIKLKSANGTSYTATIANGGTWSIT